MQNFQAPEGLAVEAGAEATVEAGAETLAEPFRSEVRCLVCVRRAEQVAARKKEIGAQAVQRAIARGRSNTERQYRAWAALLLSAFLGNVLRMQKVRCD